jgi:hypothetical protein
MEVEEKRLLLLLIQVKKILCRTYTNNKQTNTFESKG